MLMTEKVIFTPFNDGYGIVGYYYDCLVCGHHGMFEDQCKNCGNSFTDIDQDEWYSAELEKPLSERAWNKYAEKLNELRSTNERL